MSDGELLTDDTGGREYARVFLAVVCLVAVLLAAAALPALTPALSGGPTGAGTPLASLLSAPSAVPGQLGDGTTPGGASGLGALNPGSSTDIGGSLASGESGANPFRSQSNETHFTVESAQPAYWRTGAYDVYTGRGWERDSSTTPYNGAMDTVGGASELRYRVTLTKSATALPTIWQPTTVSRDDAIVTEMRALRSTTALSPGTEFSATSVRPPDDPALLRESGESYAGAVDEEYTTLTPESAARLTPFVDELTAGDNTAYDKAKTIENWLEAEKNYSLNASHGEGDIASEFVFTMDTGYCEYFATSMVAMLRSQDVPARYVVGYSTGERTGDNEYTIRGRNAHAWVEVYFPSAGWVSFDPTPASERRQQEQASVTAEPTDASEPNRDYAISVNRTKTPGATVTVTVTRGGDPVDGARVSFNGEPIGQTDTEGQVVGTIPYVDRLEITVEQSGTQAAFDPPALSRNSDRFFAVETPQAQQTTNESYELETEASLSITGAVAPGREVVVTATVDDVPVRDGTVTIDGTRAGTTDSDGRATVRLPDELDNVTLAVQRDAVTGTVALSGLSVDVTPSLPLAVPGSEAAVNATVETDPARGAAVLVDGERVGTTDSNGTATVGLPLAKRTTVTVVANGQRAQRTVGGLYRNLAGVLGAVVVAVGAVGYGARRRGITAPVALGWLRRAGQFAVGALVGLAAAVDSAIRRFRRRVDRTVDHVRDLLARRVTLAALTELLRAWITDRLSAAVDAVAADPRTDSGQSDAQATIRSAWRRLLDRVSIRHHRSRTPGEIAAHAVEEDGIPREAVTTLRDAFRAVEYGQRDPEDRVAAVEQAIERIEADDTAEERA